MSRFVLIVTLLIFIATSIAAQPINGVKFESHNLNLKLNITDQTALISDSTTVSLNSCLNMFMLNQKAVITSLQINGKQIEYQTILPTDSTHPMYAKLIEREEFDPTSSGMAVVFKNTANGSFPLVINFSAVFNDNVENARFSNENVGREVSGTILEKGTYLSPSAYYYPMGVETEAMFTITANIPSTWESVSDGDGIKFKEIDGRKIQTFKNSYKMDGLMFMAAPYYVKSDTVDGIEVFCYFFEEDSSLTESYLQSTKGYIEMYNDLIGPYPYKRFTVAENFFPTGYGMPAWTLLGQQVIRLPFIKYSSLGHEVLHNWWGNSVYVDYERGNWCEGVTVYGADYRYKLLKSESDAKDYRKNILKQYVSYINNGNDFPIREFKSRTSAGTRTIGYNKAMMVFHFIENWVGTELFFDAWKYVYKTYAGKSISWEEWITAFEHTSGEDLSFIIPQWIDRTGAPELAAMIPVGYDMTGLSLPLRLSQTQTDLYNLKIPVSAYDADGNQFDTIVFLNEPEKDFFIIPPFKIASIVVDPDYTLFRKLYPEEVEPIVSGVLGSEDKYVVAFDNDENYLAFAHNILNDTTAIVKTKLVLPELSSTAAPIIINPDQLPDFLAKRVSVTDDSITVVGTTYPKDGHTFILTIDKSSGFDKSMVILTTDPASLPRIGMLVPHYGKYSYLVFSGSKNVGKGQWEIDFSPLKIKLAASEK